MSHQAALFQAQLAAQIASVTSLLNSVQNQKSKDEGPAMKKAKYKALLLDAQGREIDESGKLVKQEGPIKTLVANVAVGHAQKKKENPYLAHRAPIVVAPVVVSSSTNTPALTEANLNSVAEIDPSAAAKTAESEEMIDDRLVIGNRERRGKKALVFAQPGKYVHEAEELRMKEERKIIAGYSSGRKAPEIVGADGKVIARKSGVVQGSDSTAADASTSSSATYMVPSEASSAAMASSAAASELISFIGGPLPPPVDEGIIPTMEWWDEAFLPKSIRDARKISRATAEQDHFSQLALTCVKTYKYVQHPVSIKALGGEKPEQPLPMFLTKKERKRIRKTAREEREREKRDKMMMGLIPAAEPKFKLSNFMKVLGDQAVADPSKVELRVLQQMQQRQTNHEMRNLAAKLTPLERSAKRAKKMQEDTGRQVHIAVFRVGDMRNAKYRFKVDVNAQQHYLSGTVLLLNPEDNEELVRTNKPSDCGCNLVVAEGGPKGIRKFVKLMTQRIPWKENAAGENNWSLQRDKNPDNLVLVPKEGEEDSDSSDSDDEEDEDGERDGEGSEKKNVVMQRIGPPGFEVLVPVEVPVPTAPAAEELKQRAAVQQHTDSGMATISNNKCVLVWQGLLPKRTFTGFKFQECRSTQAARKLLEAKGVSHYWDMASNNCSF